MVVDDTHRREILTQFGLRVRHIRTERKLSQEQLAGLGEFDRTYISLVERGKRNISLTNLVRLARALGVPPETLLKDIGDAA